MELSGSSNLVENVQKVNVDQLVRKLVVDIKKTLVEHELEAMGVNIKLITGPARFGGVRFYIECPRCGGRVRDVFPSLTGTGMACRKCLNLDYKKHRYSKMIEMRIQADELPI